MKIKIDSARALERRCDHFTPPPYQTRVNFIIIFSTFHEIHCISHQFHKMEVIKVLVNGGSGVGKSSLLYLYSNKTFSEDYVPSVFDFSTQSVIIDGEHHQVVL